MQFCLNLTTVFSHIFCDCAIHEGMPEGNKSSLSEIYGVLCDNYQKKLFLNQSKTIGLQCLELIIV